MRKHDPEPLAFMLFICTMFGLVISGAVILKSWHDHCAVDVCEEDVGG